MLYFRSEEDIDRWCSLWRLKRGAVLSIDLGWQLAKLWYAEDRREPQWQRRSAQEVETLFASLGLTSDFWRVN